MQMRCAPAAGLGRLADSQAWLTLEPLPAGCETTKPETARFGVDPDDWELIELAPGEDPLVRLRLERDFHDAVRMVLIVSDDAASPKARAFAVEALEEFLAQPALVSRLQCHVLGHAQVLAGLERHAPHYAGLAALTRKAPMAQAAAGAVHTPSLPSLSVAAHQNKKA